MPVVKMPESNNASGKNVNCKNAIVKKCQMEMTDGKKNTKEPFLLFFLCMFHIRHFGT